MTNEMINEARIALVFGGSRGISAAAVRRLAQDGFASAFNYVSRADSATALVHEVRRAGGNGR